jgi:hypothetical protein
MFFIFLLLSRFIRDGITVDDLGLLLAMVALAILFKGDISRAAVGSPVQGHSVL